MRYELSDDEWTTIKPMLPNKPRGVPRDAAVQMIDTSIVRVHQHGACITRNRRQSRTDLLDDAPDIDFGRRWKEMLAFRFGGDFHALWGAFAAAAAYARATDGVVFDGESGKVLTPDEAAESARSTEPDLEKA